MNHSHNRTTQRSKGVETKVLLLGLDGAGKSRMVSLLAGSNIETENRFQEYIFPTIGPSIETHPIHSSHFTLHTAQFPNEPPATRDFRGRQSLVHPQQYIYGAKGWSEASAPVEQEGPDVHLVDCSGDAHFRYLWRQLYGQKWLAREEGKEPNPAFLMDAIIFVVNGNDSLRIPLAWSELLNVISDLEHQSAILMSHATQTGDGSAESATGEASLNAPGSNSTIPTLVVVATDWSVVGQAQMDPYRADLAEALGVPQVLRMVEDMAPLPTRLADSISFLDFDLTSASSARQSCANVIAWIEESILSAKEKDTQ
jgi:hypothetical protein